MQEMQWDKVQRGPSQGVQKPIFPGQHFVSSVRGRGGKKKKKVVLHTKQKMPTTPFNIRVYSFFSWLQLKDGLKHLIWQFRFLKFTHSEFFLPSQLTMSFSGLPPLTCYTHVILIKCICEAIADYTVLQWSLSHFHPSSHVNYMRSLQEVFQKELSLSYLWYTIQLHS